jgi:hypothetical protein
MDAEEKETAANILENGMKGQKTFSLSIYRSLIFGKAGNLGNI